MCSTTCLYKPGQSSMCGAITILVSQSSPLTELGSPHASETCIFTVQYLGACWTAWHHDVTNIPCNSCVYHHLTFDAHSCGTALLYRLLAIVSSSCDITTNPFNAFLRSCRVARMVVSSLLYRITSWTSTVFIDSSYFTGYFFITDSRATGLGTRSRMPLHVSSTTYRHNDSDFTEVNKMNVVLRLGW